AVCVQQPQQRVDAGGTQGELEFDLGAACVGGHVAQPCAFGQRHAQGAAGEVRDQGDAVVEQVVGVALFAQCAFDGGGFVGGRGVAGLPVAPRREVGALQRGVQGNA